MISGFRREVDENCALPGCYAASCGNFLPTFRDNLSVPSLGVRDSWSLEMGMIGYPETSVINYHYSLRNNPEERNSQPGKYRVFQKDVNIFYSGHRGHRTWHPVIFSYGDTLKTMPTNHHSHKMCVNCKIAFELRCKPLMGTCWSACGRRVSYWHLQSNEGRSHWAFVSWFG